MHSKCQRFSLIVYVCFIFKKCKVISCNFLCAYFVDILATKCWTYLFKILFCILAIFFKNRYSKEKFSKCTCLHMYCQIIYSFALELIYNFWRTYTFLSLYHESLKWAECYKNNHHDDKLIFILVVFA